MLQTTVHTCCAVLRCAALRCAMCLTCDQRRQQVLIPVLLAADGALDALRHRRLVAHIQRVCSQ